MQKQGQISFIVAVLMSINIIVGAGIYFNPQPMVAQSGSVSFLGWTLAALLFAPIVWGVASAARMFPGTGGFYNYGKQGINETCGFLATWSYILGYTSTAAVLAYMLQDVLAQYFGLTFAKASPIIFNALLIGLFALLNLLSVTVISKIQSIATVLKMLPLFFVVIIFGFYWNPNALFEVKELPAALKAFPLALFGYLGFESCFGISQYLKGGTQKAFGVALTAFSIVAVLYTLFHFGLLHIMGIAGLTSLRVSQFPQFLKITSPAILSFVQWTIIGIFALTFFNSLYGLMLTNIANMTNLAHKNIFFFSDKLSLENKFFRPTLMVFLHALLLFALMALIPNVIILQYLANIGVLTAYTLTLVAVANVQRKKQTYAKLCLTLLGLLSSIVLIYFCATSIDKALAPSIFASAAAIIGMGLIMFKLRQSKIKDL